MYVHGGAQILLHGIVRKAMRYEIASQPQVRCIQGARFAGSPLVLLPALKLKFLSNVKFYMVCKAIYSGDVTKWEKIWVKLARAKKSHERLQPRASLDLTKLRVSHNFSEQTLDRFDLE